MADRQIKISVDIVSGAGGATKVKGTLNEIDSEVKRINKATADDAKRTQKVIADATKARVNEEIKDEKRLERERKAIANNFIKTINDVHKSSGSIKGSVFAGSFLGNVSANAVSSATSAIQQGAAAWLTYSSNLEQARIGMTSMIGSAAKANEHIKELQNFAKTTPFEFGELVTASQKMQGVGIAAQKVIPILRDVGNALAASGRIDELPFAIKALGDIQAKGKLAGQEIIQLANAGIPAIQMLSKHLNKTSAEILKMSEDGQISAEILFTALHKMSEERFGDAMEKQSKTFLGAMSNIKDSLLITASTAFQPLYDRISSLAVRFGRDISNQQGDFKKVGNTIGSYIGEGIGDALGNAMVFLGKATANRFVEVFSLQFVDSLSNSVFGGFLRGFGEASKGLPDWIAAAHPLGALSKAGATLQAPSTGSYGSWRPSSGVPLGFNPGPTTGLVDVAKLAGAKPSNGQFWGGIDTSGFAGGGTSPAAVRGGRSTASIARSDEPSPTAKAIIAGADKLGVSPLDYATLMLYETAGTLNPWQKGPTTKWGTHRGTIQYGESQARTYGAHRGQSFFDQVTGSNVRYLQDRGVRPGADLLTMYKAVNGGNVGASGNASDGYGTINSHVARMIRERRPQAEALLRGAGAGRGNISDEVGRMLEDQSKALTEADRNAHLDRLIELYKALGIIPDEDFLKDLHEREVKAVQAAGQSTFGMTAEGTAAKYGVNGTLAIQSRPPAYSQADIDAADLFAKTLRDLDEEQFNLNEHTREEILLREIQLGQYPGLNEEQKKLIIGKARETDEIIRKRKADEEAKDAMEEYRREQQRVFDETQDFFANKLDALIGGGFKGLWSSILDDMKRNFVDKASKLLAQMFTGGQQGGTGGIFGGIFGGGRPGSTGPLGGADPNDPYILHANGFNNLVSSTNPLDALFGGRGGSVLGNGRYSTLPPGSPGTTGAPGRNGGSGGIWSQLTGVGGMFGPRRNFLKKAGTPGAMSKVGGMMGGIGDIMAMAGQFVPGRGGKVLSYAGMGMSIGSMFGPIGAAVGAGIGAVAGLFGKKDNALDRLKSAALSEFGISVKDKKVLQSLKAVGEGMFGKGQVGNNAVAVVRSEQGQNILLAYAEGSGQSGKQVDRLNYGNAEWSGNQYRSQFGGFRANGGPVTAGYSYVVGERRPEMFTPAVNGTISPAVPNMTMSGPMMEMLDRIGTTLDRFETMSASDVIRVGAKDATREIAGAVQYEYENDGRATRRTAQANGYVG